MITKKINIPMTLRPLKFLFLSAIIGLNACTSSPETVKKPNIVIIYADDLGYGELGAYGATELALLTYHPGTCGSCRSDFPSLPTLPILPTLPLTMLPTL